MVRVDGSRIPPPRRHVYRVLNKPRGVVSTLDDPEGRRDLTEFVAQSKVRLFHVGRLDTDTEGLLILTNDGEFGHRLAHPSYEVPKTYLAEVAGLVNQATLRRLRQGIRLEDGPVRPSAVKLVSSTGESLWCGSRSTRAGTGSCAVRWKRSGIPYDGCPGSVSGRSGWAIWRSGRRAT